MDLSTIPNFAAGFHELRVKEVWGKIRLRDDAIRSGGETSAPTPDRQRVRAIAAYPRVRMKQAACHSP
jgi:hypothetical protein